MTATGRSTAPFPDRTPSLPLRQFEASFARNTPDVALRAEGAADRAFLRDLFVACSPLRDVLPVALLDQQAAAQDAAFRSAYPQAARHIVTRAGTPVGRIVIDWPAANSTHCVDIAVLPAEQSRGIGRAMLQAWLETADQLGRTARLTVLRDNPAARLYARLGFVPVAPDDGTRAEIALVRPARPFTAE